MMGGAALGVVVFPHPPPQLPCLLHHVLLCPPGPMVQVFITNACAAIRICSWCSCAVIVVICSLWRRIFVCRLVFSSWRVMFSAYVGWRVCLPAGECFVCGGPTHPEVGVGIFQH